jgi:hypothetical protein
MARWIMSMKNSNDTVGNQIIWLAAQCLNQQHYHVPPQKYVKTLKGGAGEGYKRSVGPIVSESSILQGPGGEK